MVQQLKAPVTKTDNLSLHLRIYTVQGKMDTSKLSSDLHVCAKMHTIQKIVCLFCLKIKVNGERKEKTVYLMLAHP